MSDAAEKLGPQIHSQVTDSDIESWALSTAGAIQRFIAERNALREQVRIQERELSLLREHLSLIRDSYRRLATELVTQLEIIDNSVPKIIKLHTGENPTDNDRH
jgi:hypothetical protein